MFDSRLARARTDSKGTSIRIEYNAVWIHLFKSMSKTCARIEPRQPEWRDMRKTGRGGMWTGVDQTAGPTCPEAVGRDWGSGVAWWGSMIERNRDGFGIGIGAETVSKLFEHLPDHSARSKATD